MASIKTILRKKQLLNGKFPISLRVTKDRKTKFFRTPFEVHINEWDSKVGRFNKKHTQQLKSNRLLGKIEDRALEVISDLEMAQDFYTLNDFERKFRVQSNPEASNIFSFWEELIDEMKEAGRMGNADVYHHTKNSVQKFAKQKSLHFNEVSPTFLDKYEVYLRNKGGSGGGIGVKMRAIRAIFNVAIKRGVIDEKLYPFKHYKISKLKGKAIKKALNIEEVHSLQNLDLSDKPHLINSRNYFIFSFYTRGMNFADMMKLRWENVSGDRIHYTRSKTKGNFIIKIMPPVKDILDFYAKNNKPYIFPIILRENLTPTQLNDRKRKTLKKFNKDLKELAGLAGINKPVTSYVARHSFANCLKQKGTGTDIISESLGHQDVKTTKAYLKELDTAILDEASELLLP
ncbi:site-specific integrase [Salegentibacter flavus]|uniref:Site-specific recombinase XerD n=1 Tax=Salegentibacter flavus TaxID=287099 RepID=A0A1I5B1C6_9FLAO|nr:site-specific integrase [Salegentibacter flavus]SFN68487.1 Site-specific recombinase XerD [Salegentibacter flavus]